MADRIDSEVVVEGGHLPGRPAPEFVYVFPNRREFCVERRYDDSLRITIGKKDRAIFDMDELLPAGYRFVSIEYIEALDDPETSWIPWFTDHKRKEIHVGEFEDAGDILGLLHEVGHAAIDADSEERRKWKELFAELGTEDKLYSILVQEEQAKLESVIERRAWAYSLLAMRFLSKNFGLDFKSIFTSYKSAVDYINSQLKTYRETYESLIEEDPSFREELRALFDRRAE